MTSFRSVRDRDAWATIRGYVYQVDVTLDRWLDLQPGQVLELERGEDIDVVSKAIQATDHETRQRLLEQVKHRASSLTLRSPEAIEALINFFEHRTAHPGVELHFRFVTNASSTHERPSPLPNRIPAIEAWELLRQQQGDPATHRELLHGIRSLLIAFKEEKKPKDIHEDIWKDFRAFVCDADDEAFLAFIRAFEWGMQAADANSLRGILQQRLQALHYARDADHANTVYMQMFFTVFERLTHKGLKQLTVEDREQLLAQPSFDTRAQALLELVHDLLNTLEERVGAVEKRVGTIEEHMTVVDVVQELHTGQLATLQSQLGQIQRSSLSTFNEANNQRLESQEKKQPSEKELKLRAMLADHSGFFQNRLESFVGREQELAELHRCISNLLTTGGYLIITGQAGQGKSSIIAKLIEGYGPDHIASHFIPLSPGPDHQVGLLRNLMARLILNYALPDFYVASENRAALRDYFPKVLAEVAARGGKEIIFIDGLDQLEEDLTGVRDLSFLPTNPPIGVVFVLGTRPNDTLKPLELLKPHQEYSLPNLSRPDFDRILLHRQVNLRASVADRFYQAMGENALYLDLIAKELVANDTLDPAALIERVSTNPENIFSVALERLKRQGEVWKDVIYPILGLLLIAQEPLSLRSFKNMLHCEDYLLRDGITKLGGLVISNSQHRYTLFHLKLRDFLRQDEGEISKAFLFSEEEEAQWHQVFVQWSERYPMNCVWDETMERAEQERRSYVRKHYIAHLYYGQSWQRLFDVLDEGSYGHAKERYDISGRSYLQDLDFGRLAATWNGWNREEKLTYLSSLWRYTLLRGSLRSRADQYPIELFQVFLLLNREKEAIGNAELLTDLMQKAVVFQIIAEYLAHKSDRQTESQHLFNRAYEIASTISEDNQRMRALGKLASELTKTQRQEQAEFLWDQAVAVARAIPKDIRQASAWRELVSELTEAQRWNHAEELAYAIPNRFDQGYALGTLVSELAKAQRWNHAEELAYAILENYQQAWPLRELVSELAKARCWEDAEELAYAIPEDYQQAWALQELVSELAKAQYWENAEELAYAIPEDYQQARALGKLATELAKAQRWKSAELLWKQAEKLAYAITDSHEQAQTLGELASGLTQARHWEHAELLWKNAVEVARSIPNMEEQSQALRELANELAKVQCWKQAKEIVYTIPVNYQQIFALEELASELTKAQLWEQVEEVVCAISNGELQAQALSILAKNLFEAGQLAWANTVCNQVEALVRTISNSDQSEALQALAGALAKMQRWEEAEEVVRFIPERYWQAQAWAKLAGELAKLQHWKEAELLWDKAKELAYAILDSEQQSRALQMIAGELVQAQCWEQAEKVARAIPESHLQTWTLRKLANELTKIQLWERAEEIIHSLSGSDEQPWALKELAMELAQAQRWEQAEKVAWAVSESHLQAEALGELVGQLAQAQRWEQAEKVARAIPESYGQAEALGKLASELTKGQYWEQAESLWKEAEELAYALSNSEEQSRALGGLAASLTQAQIWEQAEKLARAIPDSYHQTWVLRELASELTKVQRLEQAELLWEQAVKIACAMPSGIRREQALEGLVSELAKAQRWKQAEDVSHAIPEGRSKSQARRDLANELVKAQLWEQAETVAYTIQDSNQQAQVLKELGKSLLTLRHFDKTLALTQQSWLRIETRSSALAYFPLALELMAFRPEMGMEMHKSFKWVDTFLGG